MIKAWFEGLPTEARWVSGGAIGMVLVLLATVIFHMAALTLDNVRATARLEPRIARMLGYEASAAELEMGAKRFSTSVDGLSYPSDDDGNATGARLQQTLRGFAEDAGLIVVGSQVAIVTPEESADQEEVAARFDQLIVDLSLDGPPLALDAFLISLSQHSPALASVSMDMQRKRLSRRDSKEMTEFLSVRLRIVALRVAS
ncbi:type II secretion system protein M [Luminiphilus sp.]|nr:type II secretion system protein M [Luminiphilus sp.]